MVPYLTLCFNASKSSRIWATGDLRVDAGELLAVRVLLTDRLDATLGERLWGSAALPRGSAVGLAGVRSEVCDGDFFTVRPSTDNRLGDGVRPGLVVDSLLAEMPFWPAAELGSRRLGDVLAVRILDAAVGLPRGSVMDRAAAWTSSGDRIDFLGSFLRRLMQLMVASGEEGERAVKAFQKGESQGNEKGPLPRVFARRYRQNKNESRRCSLILLSFFFNSLMTSKSSPFFSVRMQTPLPKWITWQYALSQIFWTVLIAIEILVVSVAQSSARVSDRIDSHVTVVNSHSENFFFLTINTERVASLLLSSSSSRLT